MVVVSGQVGRVCMDQFMVEVDAWHRSASRGDEFVLVGEQGAERISMEELAELAGTINYEMACAFGMRSTSRLSASATLLEAHRGMLSHDAAGA